jgi:hypothetical protein
VLRTFARESGDIVLFHVLMQERILLNHPDFVEQELVLQQDKFHKSELTRRITERMLGQGLLTSGASAMKFGINQVKINTSPITNVGIKNPVSH